MGQEQGTEFVENPEIKKINTVLARRMLRLVKAARKNKQIQTVAGRTGWIVDNLIVDIPGGRRRTVCIEVSRNEITKEEGVENFNFVPDGFKFPVICFHYSDSQGSLLTTSEGILPEIFLDADNKLFGAHNLWYFNRFGQATKVEDISPPMMVEDEEGKLKPYQFGISSEEDDQTLNSYPFALSGIRTSGVERIEDIPKVGFVAQIGERCVPLKHGDYEFISSMLHQLELGNRG